MKKKIIIFSIIILILFYPAIRDTFKKVMMPHKILMVGHQISEYAFKFTKEIKNKDKISEWVNDWYVNRGFVLKEQYLHVYVEENECNIIGQPQIKDLLICNFFAHYVGEDKDEIKNKFKRIHECNMYELIL